MSRWPGKYVIGLTGNIATGKSVVRKMLEHLGAYGIETLIGIIQPPQTAILGVGSVMSQAAVRDGAIVAREMMKVALSADHRATDGAQGAQFLAEIKRLLEQPLLLVL